MVKIPHVWWLRFIQSQLIKSCYPPWSPMSDGKGQGPLNHNFVSIKSMFSIIIAPWNPPCLTPSRDWATAPLAAAAAAANCGRLFRRLPAVPAMEDLAYHWPWFTKALDHIYVVMGVPQIGWCWMENPLKWKIGGPFGIFDGLGWRETFQQTPGNLIIKNNVFL